MKIMKELLKGFVLSVILLLLTINPVFAESKMDKIASFLKDELVKLGLTNVNVYNDAENSKIEMSWVQNASEKSTAIEYRGDMIFPYYHLNNDLAELNGDNHKVDIAMAVTISRLINDNFKYMLGIISGYSDASLNKYLSSASDENLGFYMDSDEEYSSDSKIDISKFSLGRNYEAPTVTYSVVNSKGILTINSKDGNGEIVEILRSTDGENFVAYKTIEINNNTSIVELETGEYNYYYKAAIEGTNNWSDIVLASAPDLNENNNGSNPSTDNTDKDTENPQTGIINYPIILLLSIGCLYLVFNKIRKFNKIKNI